MLQQAAWFFLPGASPAARALAAVDWSSHPLGPPTTWPVALQLALATMLRGKQPALLCWGKPLFMFANDGALATVDGSALGVAGCPARQAMPSAFRAAGPAEQQPLGACSADACDWFGLEAAVAAGDINYDDGRPAQGWTPVFDEGGRLRGGLVTGAVANLAGVLPGEVAQVLERMTDSFFMVDAQWRIVCCNEQHARITKMPRSEQVGRSFIELFLREDTPHNRRYLAMYTQVMQTQRAVSFTDYYPPLDLWTELNVYPTEGRGFAVFCRDVTTLHKTSRALRTEKHKFEAIFAASPVAMAVLCGHELVFEHANARYEALIGNRSTKGRKFFDIFHELRDSPYMEILRQVLATGEPYTALERRVELIVRAGGGPEERFLDFVYQRVADEQGTPYGVYIYANDVTDRLRARLQLVDALRARDDLLSICSHQLRTPVASMKLSTQMFKRGLQHGDVRSASPERLARMVEQSDRQLDRLSRLIDEILDFSRIHSGQLHLQVAPCDLAGVVRDTLGRLRPQLEASGTAVALELPRSLPCRCDDFRLEQLLTNLVTNAQKYGGKKPIQVALQDLGEEVLLAVQDGGPGISAADQDRIFLPYERAVSVHNISGLGLGLYIARQIVLAHGGTIGVHSTPGEGARFEVRLPKQGCADAAAATVKG